MGILIKKRLNKEAIIKFLDEKRLKIIVWWEKIHTGEKIQIYLLLTNVIMILAFIYFSNKQVSRIDKSLNWADSSNVSTKKSLLIAEENMKLANRAYVSVSNISTFGDSIYYDIIHSGNTPALELASYPLFVLGKNIDLSACRKYIDQFVKKREQNNETEFFTIGENKRFWAHLQLYQAGPKSQIAIVLHNHTVEEIELLKRGSYEAYFLIKVVYSDWFNGRDTTWLTRKYNFNGGGTWPETKYNYMK